MIRVVQLLAAYLVLAGISGTIDHLAVQPILGPVLNFFNRYVIAHLDFLAGFEIYANLSVSVLGLVIGVAADRVLRRSRTGVPAGSSTDRA